MAGAVTEFGRRLLDDNTAGTGGDRCSTSDGAILSPFLAVRRQAGHLPRARSSAESRRESDICQRHPRPTIISKASAGECALSAIARAATSSSRFAMPSGTTAGSPSWSRNCFARGFDLIVAGGPASRAAPLAGASVPVVFGFSGDPVDAGIVASFARPGGNATGVSFLALDLSVKRLDLLKEAKPTMTRVAVLSNPDHAGDASELKATRETADALGLAIEHFEVRTDDGFEPMFAAIAQSKCDGLLAFPDALTNFNRQKIVAFALRGRLPSIYGWKMYAEAGGLMSYGPVLYGRLRAACGLCGQGPQGCQAGRPAGRAADQA